MMFNNTKKVEMTTTLGTRRAGYELLLKRNFNHAEQNCCSSEPEIMEPDGYGPMLNPNSMITNLSGPPSVPSLGQAVLPSISSSTTGNYENNPPARRYPSKKRYTPCSSVVIPSIDSPEERIEVKILPQDDNWGETTTITYNGANDDSFVNNNDVSLQTDDHNLQRTNSYPNLLNHTDSNQTSIKFCHWLNYVLCLIAFVSPVLYLTLPYALNGSDSIIINDYTLLLTIIFKLIFLLIGTLLLLYRRRNTSDFPRLQIVKTLLTILLTIILLTYWLYYVLELLLKRNGNYDEVLSMTSYYENLLVIYLLLVVVILELKWIYPKWIVKVVRSPDGLTRHYTIGSMSIQEASVYLLEQYYKDFPVFNPWLENAQRGLIRQHTISSNKSIGSQSNASTMLPISNGNKHISSNDVRRSMRATNDRFYDELDYERRVRKRRAKLLSSCEDAFTHIRKCHTEKYGSNTPLDCQEAAQAVFLSMSRPLQKYLRATRQQPYFTRESIVSHLSLCLSHDLSPRAFLERYTQIESQPLATLLFPALETNKGQVEQSWTISCNLQSSSSDNERNSSPSINRSISSHLVVVLKQKHAEHIALICTFHAMPKVCLREKILNSKENKFILKLNSETSV